jgi:hypothetical protein
LNDRHPEALREVIAAEEKMPERIRGKVAQILNVRELVINRGSDAGVIEGMEFAVLNRQGTRIVDPDTEQELGSVEIPKVLVRVVRVEPRLAVARTYITHTRVTGALGSRMCLLLAK